MRSWSCSACMGVEHGAGFGQCHEVLKQVADTWTNILAIPFRGDPQDDLNEGEPRYGWRIVSSGGKQI